MKKHALLLSLAFAFRCTPELEPIESRDVTMKLCPCADPSAECLEKCEIVTSVVSGDSGDGSSSGGGTESIGGLGGGFVFDEAEKLQLGCFTPSSDDALAVGSSLFLRVRVPHEKNKLDAQERLVEVESSGALSFLNDAGEPIRVVHEFAPNVHSIKNADGDEISLELVFPVRATSLGTGVIKLIRPIALPELSFARRVRQRPPLGLIQTAIPRKDETDSGNAVSEPAAKLNAEGLVTICSQEAVGTAVIVEVGEGVSVPSGLKLDYALDNCPEDYGSSVTFPVASAPATPKLRVTIAGQAIDCTLSFDEALTSLSIIARPDEANGGWYAAPGDARLQNVVVEVEGTLANSTVRPVVGASIDVLNTGVSVLGGPGVTGADGKANIILSVAKTVDEFGLVLSVAGRTQKLIPWQGPGEGSVGGAGGMPSQ